ncbi:hypothetical protein [Pseudoalteromonas rubra]|uniref:hypothetical protein n=1 Tax=Pseudoalteromonas rubra TaxID=43658 RepID=UPI001108A436|nr:hypothetical protein [Pseudoalteromonas rubra]
MKQVTVGTTGGIVFSFICGILCSLLIATIYRLSWQSNLLNNLSLILYLILLAIMLLSAREAFSLYISDVRKDVFLIASQFGNYQRPAAFMFMTFMVAVSLAAMHLSLFKSLGRIAVILCTCLLGWLSYQFMMLSQLIGSNSGMVTVFGFFIVYLTLLSILKLFKSDLDDREEFKLSSLIFSRVGLKYIIYLPLVLFIVFWLVLFYVSKQNIDLDSLRIFGYGSSLSSFETRLALLDNFIVHFSYSPLFGNMIVEKLTTGDGTYVHSLFALLPHLGIIGTIIFLIFLKSIFNAFRTARLSPSESYNIYLNKYYVVYRTLGLTAVLVFCTFSAFFTWLPLWYAFGLFGMTLIDGERTRYE